MQSNHDREKRMMHKTLKGVLLSALLLLSGSVLAADALDEAVYDYLQKNKKEISLDLQKRHEIILKSKESIEHRYHDWISLEEQLRHKKK